MPLYTNNPWSKIATLVLILALESCSSTSVESTSGVDSGPSLRRAATARGVDIGTATGSHFLGEAAYTDVLRREFSVLEAENEMKFEAVHPRPNSEANAYAFTGPDALVAFAQTHGIRVRGHTLVWHMQVPKWVTEGGHDSAWLSAILKDHIATVVAHYGTRIYAWDVVNEAFNDDGTMRDTIWYNQPGIGFAAQGTQYIEQSLRWARAAEPKTLLFYNDYSNETINAKSDAIYAMAKNFRERGVPLNGIGFQMHVDLSFDNPATLASFKTNLQRFAALGLQLHITELDVRLNNSKPASLAAQAELYGKITKICVQQPACKLIQTWGFTDKYSWIPSFFHGTGWALPWDEDYHKKPAYFGIRDAL